MDREKFISEVILTSGIGVESVNIKDTKISSVVNGKTITLNYNMSTKDKDLFTLVKLIGILSKR